MYTPAANWNPPAGIRHYTQPDGTCYCLEVGLRADGRIIVHMHNPDEEDEANARLIAQAPTLLEALKDAENNLRGVAYEQSQCIVAGHHIDTLYRTADRVHAAIKAATE